MQSRSAPAAAVAAIHTVQRELTFSSARRVRGHCDLGKVHGHNFTAGITIAADALGKYGNLVMSDDMEGLRWSLHHKFFIGRNDPLLDKLHEVNIDLGLVEKVFDFFYAEDNPTIEYLANHIAETVMYLARKYNDNATLCEVHVELFETPQVSAFATRSWRKEQESEEGN